MLTQDYLKSVIRYDTETGDFTWLKSVSKRVSVGQSAGYVDEGYLKIKIDGTKYRAHRLAWFYVHGVWPDNLLDHEDGDALNNRISNLRLATRTQNNRNKTMYSNNTSGVTGVTWCNEMLAWRVRLRLNGVNNHLGFFADLEEATIAADGFRQNHHEEFYRENRA